MLLTAIDDFLAKTGISPSAFGKAAMGDPNFVRDLRGGREPKRRLVEKAEAYMRDHSPPPLHTAPATDTNQLDSANEAAE